MDARFSSRVFWSESDEGYIAIVPEMPNVSAFGETQEEAVKELGIALEVTLEALKKDGIELPQPKGLPEHSGQLRIRIPSYLHTHLALSAEDEGISLNSYIISLLSGLDRTRRLESKIDQLGDKISKIQRRQGEQDIRSYHFASLQSQESMEWESEPFIIQAKNNHKNITFYNGVQQ